MGTQIIIFGGLKSDDVVYYHHVEEGPTDTTDIETEVWNLETGESKMIVPSLSQAKYSLGIALYFVDNAKFCQAPASSDTTGAF